MTGELRGGARVTVIGDALIDELVDESGTLRIVGGSALNVATGLSILGAAPTLVAMVGDDDDGALIRAHLERYRIDLLPTISALGTGVARSERRGGEPIYSFSAPMLHREIAFDAAQRESMRSAAVVAVSGFPLDAAAQAQLLEDALGAADGVIALDPNPRSGMLRDAQAFAHALERLGGVVDLLKLGDEDAQMLWGTSVAAATPALRDRYTHVLATAGGDGARMHVPGSVSTSRALAAAADVVDTMGAGDSVFASMLAEIARDGLEGVDWDAALHRAMGVAAETVAHPGALLRVP